MKAMACSWKERNEKRKEASSDSTGIEGNRTGSQVVLDQRGVEY